MSNNCRDCALCKASKYTQVDPKGSSNPDYYIVSYTSSEYEVMNNNPFDINGSTGNSFLMNMLSSLGINEGNARFNKCIRCVSDNRTITDEHKDACVKYLMQDIFETKPKIVIGLGSNVGSVFLGSKFRYLKFSRGRLYDVNINGYITKFLVTYSPDYVTDKYKEFDEEDTESSEDYTKLFYDDLVYCNKYVNDELIDISKKDLRYALNFEEFNKYYEEFLVNAELPSYDIESNAKDPRCADFRIIGYSLAPNGDTGIYVVRKSLEYEMDPDDWNKCVEVTKNYINTKTVLVHNIMYEKPATYNEWGLDINNFEDTLVKARMLLGGKTGAGLKDQCILNLGYPEWDADLSDYINNFSIIWNKLYPTSAGKDRWDFTELKNTSLVELRELYRNMIETYNLTYDKYSMYDNPEDYITSEDKKIIKDNYLSDRELSVLDAIDAIEALLSEYYSDDLEDILNLVGKEIVFMIDTRYEGMVPYSSIPLKIIVKYGAMDSVGTQDLNVFLSSRMNNESTDEVNLWNGYDVMKRHFKVGSYLEMNGLYWNDKVATETYNVLAGLAKESLIKMLMSGYLDDIIISNGEYLLIDYLKNNPQIIESELGEVSYQKSGIKLSNGTRVTWKNILAYMSKSWKDSMKPYILQTVKESLYDSNIHPDYNSLKYLFNPSSAKNVDILNRTLVTSDLKVGYIIEQVTQLVESDGFDINSIKKPDRFLFEVISNIHKYNKEAKEYNEDNPDNKKSLISSRQLFSKFKATLNDISFNDNKVIRIINDGINYKLQGTSEPLILELYSYFVASGIDIEDESTWTDEFRFLYNFRLYKKCVKLISSYIDGSRIGRGSVWVVDKKDIDENKVIPIRKRKYSWSESKKDTEEYLLQPSWGVCFTGDTRILSESGHLYSFKELVDNEIEEIWTYSINLDNKIVMSKLQNPRITRKNAELVEVLFNSSSVKCTPDHLFMIRGGSYKKAEELSNKDSVVFINRIYNPRLSKYDTVESYNSVVSVIKLDYKEDVYDAEVPMYHNFTLGNGAVVHNCTAETLRWRGGVHTIPAGVTIKSIYTSRYAHGVIAAPDYSQLEIRIAAGLSGDENLLEVFNSGGDVHTRTAMSIFQKPADQITKVERRYSKMACRVGSSKIKLLDGRIMTMNELYESGMKDFYTYSYDIDNKRVVPGHVTDMDLTKYVNTTVKLTFDNGFTDECTLDHKYLCIDGKYVEAKDLLNCKIETLFTRIPTKGAYAYCKHNPNYYEQYRDVRYEYYCGTRNPNKKYKRYGKWSLTHKMVAIYKYGEIGELQVDHIDNNSLNNDPSNIQLLSSIQNRYKSRFRKLDNYGHLPMSCKIIKWLLDNDLEFNKENYDNNRKIINPDKSNRGILTYDKLMSYGYSTEELIELSKSSFTEYDINETLYYDPVKIYRLDEIACVKCINVEIIHHDNPVPVYDVSVDKYHNYAAYLGDNTSVFTHNSFRILYGSTAEGMAQQFLGGDVELAHKIIDGFYEAYPKVKVMMDKRHDEVEKYGRIQCDRVGYYLYIDTHGPEGLEGAKRQAGNYGIQSQGSMIGGYVLNEVNDYILKNHMYTKPISFIHDSLEFDIHPDELFKISKQIIPMMNEIPISKFGIPTKADLTLGLSMGMENEVKEIDCDEDFNSGIIKFEGFRDDLDRMYDNWKDYYKLVEYEDGDDVEVVYFPRKDLFQEKLSWNQFIGKSREMITRIFKIIIK